MKRLLFLSFLLCGALCMQAQSNARERLEQYKKHFNTSQNLDPIEGIWETEETYTQVSPYYRLPRKDVYNEILYIIRDDTRNDQTFYCTSENDPLHYLAIIQRIGSTKYYKIIDHRFLTNKKIILTENGTVVNYSQQCTEEEKQFLLTGAGSLVQLFYNLSMIKSYPY